MQQGAIGLLPLSSPPMTESLRNMNALLSPGGDRSEKWAQYGRVVMWTMCVSASFECWQATTSNLVGCTQMEEVLDEEKSVPPLELLVVEHKYPEGRWLVAWAAVYRHIYCWTLYTVEKNVLLGSISIHHACKEL